MSWRRRAARGAAVVALGLTSVASGLYVSALFAPQRLRLEVERRLALATGAPCRIASLRVEPGLPLEVRGRGLSLWDGALRVERASARVSLSSALVGQLRLASLELDGAVLRIGGDAPAFADLGGAALPATLEDAVAALGGAAQALLAGPRPANALRVRRGRVELGAPDLVLDGLHAELAVHRLRGDQSLVAQARLEADGAYRGLLEWQASGAPDGALRATLTASELDLGWLARRLDAGAPRARAWLSGVADLRVAGDGRAGLELDFVARDVALAGTGDAPPWLAAPRVGAELRVEAEPSRLRVGEARFESGPIELVLQGTLARPLGADSELALRARAADVEIAELRTMVADTAAAWTDDLKAVLDALSGGRVASLELRGAAPWRAWAAWLESRAETPLDGLELHARVEQLRVRLEGDDAIENVAGRLRWAGDRIALRELRAERGGVPLPELDLELDGLSYLLAADLGARVPDSERVRLAGLPLLLSLFEPEEGSEFRAPHVDVALERLEHPTLLWPMRGVDLAIDHRDGALVGRVRRATWGGVPLRGELEWRDDPMRLVARLAASAPPRGAVAPAPAGDGVWASGRVEVGALASRFWAHEWMRGRVRAVESTVYADGIDAALEPGGTLEGSAEIGLGDADAIPYRAAFTALGLDAGALLERAGLGDGLASGRVDLRGDLRARYRRERPPFEELSGRLELDARDGTVRHDVPAVLALTLASESLDLTPRRENVRYTRCSASLQLVDGVMQTDALELDGPDVRLFGSGTLDLGRPPHALDAEVVVFLFRPVDRALGGIPLLGDLILGGADNLFAAYFELEGPWDAPTASARPLRSFNAGPMRLVTGLPAVVLRGLEALGGAMRTPAADGAAMPTPGADDVPIEGDAAPPTAPDPAVTP